MSDRLQNWNNWRYLPIGTKQREAWHELDRLYRQNKEQETRLYELEQPEKVKTINDFVYVRKDVILNILNGMENDK